MLTPYIKNIDVNFCIQVIPNAGHHVFADQFEVFNNLIDKICQENVIEVEE